MVETALEKCNDGAEGRRFDVGSVPREPEGRATSPLPVFVMDSPPYERRMTSPGPWFPVLDLSSDEDEDRVSPPLHLFDHLDSPTYEELFEQNWALFEDSDQELEEKKRRPPPKTAIMVSDDENGDEVESEVEEPSASIVEGKGFWESCQSQQPIDESEPQSESSVRHKGREQVIPWDSPLGTSMTTRFLPTSPTDTSEAFTEHLARCMVDWDYPAVLFSVEGYEPLHTGETSAGPGPDSLSTVPAQHISALALEQKSTPNFSASNEFSLKKRRATSNDPEGFHRLQLSGSLNVLGLENIEPTTKPAPRQNKRRRVA